MNPRCDAGSWSGRPLRGAGVRTRAGSRVLAAGGALAFWFACLPVGALAASPDWQAGAATVRDLMQGELRPAPAVPAPRPALASSGVRLTALYGTAGQLTAVLDVGGVRKEYRPGASLPYGGNGSATEYRLVRIVDTCVVLRRGTQGRLRTACYAPTSPVPRPSSHVGASPAMLAAPLPVDNAGVSP